MLGNEASVRTLCHADPDFSGEASVRYRRMTPDQAEKLGRQYLFRIQMNRKD